MRAGRYYRSTSIRRPLCLCDRMWLRVQSLVLYTINNFLDYWTSNEVVKQRPTPQNSLCCVRNLSCCYPSRYCCSTDISRHHCLGERLRTPTFVLHTINNVPDYWISNGAATHIKATILSSLCTLFPSSHIYQRMGAIAALPTKRKNMRGSVVPSVLSPGNRTITCC